MLMDVNIKSDIRLLLPALKRIAKEKKTINHADLLYVVELMEEAVKRIETLEDELEAAESIIPSNY
jgi:hypothetical protein